MASYSIAEASSNLPALVHEAEASGPVKLTRQGEAVAVVLSMKEYQRLLGKPDFYDSMMRFRQEYAQDLSDEPFLPEHSQGREDNPWGQ